MVGVGDPMAMHKICIEEPRITPDVGWTVGDWGKRRTETRLKSISILSKNSYISRQGEIILSENKRNNSKYVGFLASRHSDGGKKPEFSFITHVYIRYYVHIFNTVYLTSAKAGTMGSVQLSTVSEGRLSFSPFSVNVFK